MKPTVTQAATRPLHYFCLSDYGDFGLCGPDIQIEITVAAKKDVTCKKCLRLLEAKR